MEPTTTTPNKLSSQTVGFDQKIVPELNLNFSLLRLETIDSTISPREFEELSDKELAFLHVDQDDFVADRLEQSKL